MDIDTARAAFERLSSQIGNHLEFIVTEQDARFQIIDKILQEVLGWEAVEVSTEPHVQDGYIDYLLHHGERNRLVVEAKRQETKLIDTGNTNIGYYKLGGAALNSAASSISQVRHYCVQSGVQFCGITTGTQWIAFLAVRADGKPPDEGKAIVFPSLDAILSEFAQFYDLFSKEGILEKRYQFHINTAEGLTVHPAEILVPVVPKHQIRMLERSQLSLDLERIFSEFFASMSDDDPEMLANCFVESKESREADISLEKIASNLINTIKEVDSQEGVELQQHIKSAVLSKRGEFVLVVGNKGAGKSTFIDRFFRLVLDRPLLEKCLVIRLDLADSTGDMKNLAAWLTSKLKLEIEKTLFEDGIPNYDELQGVFFSDYNRWKYGEFKHLYESDYTKFKIQFGEKIAKSVEEKQDDYVLNLLKHSIRSRKLMPCLVFDNMDHFPQDYQEAVFQYAQSIFRSLFSFIICPITDRTIWQLSKSGPFQSYETKAFYLPVPSTKEVLEKRVKFIKSKIDEERIEGEYFLKRGIRVTINDIRGFAAFIEEIFLNTEYISRRVGWLSNHDIRRSLQLSKRIVTSPLLNTEALIGSYFSTGKIRITEFEINRALIAGNYNVFNEEDSEFILNVFTIDPQNVTSPLAKLSILRLLIDQDNAADGAAERAYLAIEQVQNYFEAVGLMPTNCLAIIDELLSYRLVDPYDPSLRDTAEVQRIRITPSGRIHYELATQDRIYIQQMARVTGLRNEATVQKVRDILQQKMGGNDWRRMELEFLEYCTSQDRIFFTIPDLEMYRSQKILRKELVTF